MTTKPDPVKKTEPAKQADRKSDKGEDIFSILLSLSMNIANQGVKVTGVEEKKIDKEPPIEAGEAGAAGAADKKGGNDRKGGDDIKSLPVVKEGEGIRGIAVGKDNPPPLQQVLSPLEKRRKGEDNTSTDFVPPGETTESTVSDNGWLMGETEFKIPVDNLSDNSVDILPDNIVNSQIENSDNNKLLNDNGMLVTAVKGTPVNTEGNIVSSQPVYRYADQGNLIQYMSQQIIHASHVGTHTAKIRLSPAELGDLRLDISVSDKNVKALIIVENEEIKKMVESSFNSLRDELKNQGLNIEQFSVEIQQDDFMDNFKSMYEKQEKDAKKWGNIVPDKNSDGIEHPVIIPLSWIRGGLSIFA